MPKEFKGTIKINGKKISFFSEVKINLLLDSVASVFSFKARFNPENDDHKELFKPLQYQTVEIYNQGGELILTGTCLNHSFVSDSKNNLVAVSGYSKSGVLEDVCVPVSAYPLESLNRSLKDIAQRLCGLFGVGLIIDASVAGLSAQVYPSTETNPTDTVKTYLSKLTSQKNIVLSHDAKGNVVLFKPNDKMTPRYFFNQDNIEKATANFSGQGMHSLISVVRQPSDENSGSETVDTITNPLIKSYRPVTKTLSSGEDTDTSNAANNELANELKNIQHKITLVGYFDDIFPGDIVNIHIHEVYSFAYSRYMVSEVGLNFDTKQEMTELTLVLPETYTGKQPKDILFYYKSHRNGI